MQGRTKRWLKSSKKGLGRASTGRAKPTYIIGSPALRRENFQGLIMLNLKELSLNIEGEIDAFINQSILLLSYGNHK